MIEVHALAAVLTVEALIVLVTTLVILLLRSFSKKRAAHEQANLLVNRINESEQARLSELEESFAIDNDDMDASLRRQTAEAVSQSEKALYKEVIQAFLNHDGEKLAQLDRHVSALAKPYCSLVKQFIDRTNSKESEAQAERRSALEAEIKQTRQALTDTQKQLQDALGTLTEVSGEYTKMFSKGKQTDELNASRERMLAAFQRGETNVQGRSQ